MRIDELSNGKPLRLVNPDTRIGFELEVTGVLSEEISSRITRDFRCEPDGSLRGDGRGYPMEFTFNRPMTGAEAESALDTLYSDWNSGWVLCHRGSTHIHVDVADLELHQLGWLVLISAALEDYLFSLAGSGYRQDSMFCRGLFNNPDIIGRALRNVLQGPVKDLPTLLTAIGTSNPRRGLRQSLFGQSVGSGGSRTLKYTSLNLHSVESFRSVEYRHFRPVGTFSEAATIINAVTSIKECALASDPLEKFDELFGDTAPPSARDTLHKLNLMLEVI